MTEPTLREALKRLVEAWLDYSPQDHNWRCEYRKADMGWVRGTPPIIRCECGFDELAAAVLDAQAALAATPPPLLPTFEVGQVVGDLQPGRHRHDRCSIHGDIGPEESIDAHARRVHGSGSEAIRKARKVLKRAAALTPTGDETR